MTIDPLYHLFGAFKVIFIIFNLFLIIDNHFLNSFLFKHLVSSRSQRAPRTRLSRRARPCMVDCRAASNTTSTLVHQSASYSPLRGTEPQNNRENRPRPRLPQSRWRAAGGGQYKGKGGWRSRPPVFAGTANTTPTYQSGLPRAIRSRGFRRFHGEYGESEN